ncbi:MAG TPA: TRP-like protein [Polyangiaceae bacterium]|nr:TRP-like protein [Polyangiaceae bacterium]
MLLREKRYEEALAMLYRARSEAPDSGELQKSIDQIKEFLIGAYAKRLGGLDQIAKPFPVNTVRSPDVVLLSRYIDGTSTFGDVAQMSPLGQLRTLQVLVGLYSRPESPLVIQPAAEPTPAFEPALEAPPPESARRPSSAPTARSEPSEPLVQVIAETEEARRYRETFALGTAAYVQRRFTDAVAAFEACAVLRPGDAPSAVMIRRSLRDLALESR